LQADHLRTLFLYFLYDQLLEDLFAQDIGRRQRHRWIGLRSAFDDKGGLIPHLALEYDAFIDDSGNAIKKFAGLGQLVGRRDRSDAQGSNGTQAST
jgi:hypothetical protein